MARATQIPSPVLSKLPETKRIWALLDVLWQTSIFALCKQDGTIGTKWNCHMCIAIAKVMVVTNIVLGLIARTQQEPISQMV